MFGFCFKLPSLLWTPIQEREREKKTYLYNLGLFSITTSYGIDVKVDIQTKMVLILYGWNSVFVSFGFCLIFFVFYFDFFIIMEYVKNLILNYDTLHYRFFFVFSFQFYALLLFIYVLDIGTWWIGFNYSQGGISCWISNHRIHFHTNIEFTF